MGAFITVTMKTEKPTRKQGDNKISFNPSAVGKKSIQGTESTSSAAAGVGKPIK